MLVTCGAPLPGSAVHAQSLEVIQLQHRSAEDLLPLLQPLLNPGGALTGQGEHLFMRANAQSAANIRQALLELDRTPRQLLISVRQGNTWSGSEQPMGGELRLQTGESISRPGGGSAQLHLQTEATQGNDRTDNVTQVRVLEGNGARIMAGQSVPVVSAFVSQNGGVPVIQSSTRYRHIQSGFSVTPRLTAEGVILEISQQAQTSRSSVLGTIDTQQISTTIAGRLGEWIPLGGVEEGSSSRSTGIGTPHLETQHDSSTLWVRVETR